MITRIPWWQSSYARFDTRQCHKVHKEMYTLIVRECKAFPQHRIHPWYGPRIFVYKCFSDFEPMQWSLCAPQRYFYWTALKLHSTQISININTKDRGYTVHAYHITSIYAISLYKHYRMCFNVIKSHTVDQCIMMDNPGCLYMYQWGEALHMDRFSGPLSAPDDYVG